MFTDAPADASCPLPNSKDGEPLLDPYGDRAGLMMYLSAQAGPLHVTRSPRAMQASQGPGTRGDEAAEASFQVRRVHVRARLTTTGLSLEPLGRIVRALPWATKRTAVDFDDIVSAEVVKKYTCLSMACFDQVHALVIHAIKRKKKKCVWRQSRICLTSADGALVQAWAVKIWRHLHSQQHRPKQLLVLMNPYGGARMAKQIWLTLVEPIFTRAGISFTAIETEREAHAREVVERLPLQDLQQLDGIVAIGGDGVFQEVLNGILHLRKSQDDQIREAAEQVRLGHIPAGSTDAVAYSVHGTRDTLTAALHIAMGDRMALDILRIDTRDGLHRYATCVAAYGYLGDLMHRSEGLRWMGPSRYNIAGALTLFEGRGYHATVSFLASAEQSISQRQVCSSECNVCNSANTTSASPRAFSRSSLDAVNRGGWQRRQGTFKSIMVVLIPCRSDRSAQGLAPYSHLADGRLQLIMVQNCSRLQYLRFLASIPAHGVQQGQFPYVEIVEATAVQVTPSGKESWWSVDGELLANNFLTAEVHRGLITVFGRGPEL